ncbi:MAG: 7,8-didemethyl-8-hydroxy-5-deazariboflavin synthase subunit CofG [Methanothrix sp.]|jgi:FO synthase subunit 1|nr:MAG: FO synthase subunit 1 [Methanosaeta sp. SDB]MCP1393509.1 7,8-didemethyl-8-hydroxy-5-deazariboflavin synthase subunit CofG [Methanothrix harundinacea]MDD3710790.1 7,8-didemethyl-8-hydroxy-5-deazariboflavin synthase subunit CofG [Methanothrix sp.]MDD5768774.1 7,8-didemethyl-8-hydroxy-5-deazariboflavin synthase subunit CofG [Methanothrix sp.]MDI9399164.1 7,8-didemethyl-8-hydroxy-5-deazariboflavin synthase subunit CofG [Euryarchaeota archaeon]
MRPLLTYSRNVFIPVTNVCRNRCLYCGYRRDEGKIIDRKEAIELLERGASSGCTEALFSLGEAPNKVSGFGALLKKTGCDDLIDYIIELSEMALDKDLLPHTNAGLISKEDMRRLAPYNASMGLMLETTAEVEAHRSSPGKRPELRLAAIEAAGKLKIPFTTGILVGIGETEEDRVRSIQALKKIHEIYGHIQEVIVQPFDPKQGTAMSHLDPPDSETLAETVRMARSILPPTVAVQVPPNLTDPLPLVEAGAEDLGGISPVTPDWINPNKLWPTPEELESRLSGFELRERLAVYPRYIDLGWCGKMTQTLVKRLAGPDGLRRRD